MEFVGSILKVIVGAVSLILATVFAVRAIDSMRGPPLSPWHTKAPADATSAEIDAMDWPQWMARENAVFAQVQAEIVAPLPADARQPQNRYWADAPMHPAALATDWNRSFTLESASPPRGAAVMLHGMTDAPYSLRHVARHYQALGYHVVAIRLPGHGTVPAGIAKARAEDWEAATRLAVREARRAAPGQPLHMVGYSNGGTLAIIHAADATANAALGMPDRIILVSPMIGLTPFARFAGIAGWPAFLPAFAKAAWLDIIPEYNPFKYNSFPVNAGVQAHRLTVHLAERLNAAQADGRITALPPMLALLSVVDSTVEARAVMTGLFDRLPANGSELIVVDINRTAKVGPLIRASAANRINQFVPTTPRRYQTSIIASGEGPGAPAIWRSFAPGSTSEVRTPVPISYPTDFYSLSHIALPFPLSDGLYGAAPDPADDQGITLGALALRGENGVLTVGMGTFNRVSSNPFFALFLDRIEAVPAATAPRAQAIQ